MGKYETRLGLAVIAAVITFVIVMGDSGVTTKIDPVAVCSPNTVKSVSVTKEEIKVECVE